jgi:hypothetical protein
MQPASTLGETPIPPSPPAEGQREPAPGSQATAPQAITPEAAAGVHAALMRLVWLYLYVTIMGLFGYRMRRQRNKRTLPANPPAQPRATSPAAQKQPRKKHKYLDRDMVLGVFAGINSDLGAAIAKPVPADSQSQRASADPDPGTAAGAQQSRPPIPAALPPKIILLPRLASPRARHLAPMPPPFSKPSLPRPPTHAHFVAISQ